MLQASASYSEETLNDLSDYFHGAPLGLHITGADGTITRTNLAELELLGYRDHVDEYIGHHLAEFHADADAVQAMLDGLIAGEPISELEATLVRRDGTPQKVLLYANARFQDGAFAGMRCVTFPHPDDLRGEIAELAALTDQSVESRGLRLSEQERDELYAELEDFFQHSPVNGHIVGGDGLIKHANESEIAAMGYPADAYLGQHIARFHAEQTVIDGMLEDLVGGTPLINFSATLFHRDGSRLPVMIYSNSRMRGGSFVNTRCFTVPMPQSRRLDREAHEAFSWPRNEDFGFTVGSHAAAGPPNPMTVALKYIASRKRPEESLGFLARVSETFSGAAPFDVRLRSVLALSVPFLADLASVDVGSTHLADASGGSLRGCAADVVQRLAAASAGEAPVEEEALGVASLIRVPVAIRGTGDGVLSLARENSPGRRPFGPADRALAQELARRIAFAIELAQLTGRS
jgi:PAS domain-containing protein